MAISKENAILLKINYKLFVLFSIVLLPGTDGASLSGEDKVRQKRNIICYFGLNDVIKETLYSSLEDVRKNDPLELGDTSDGKLQDGVLKGLSTLTNRTELKVYCDDHDLLTFSTTLGMKNAEILYKWKRKFVFKMSGSIWMNAKEVDFQLEVKVNNTCGLTFAVTNTLVTKLDNFRFGFRGLGPLNPIVKGAMNMLYKLWNGKATKKIENLIKKSLEKKLQEISDVVSYILPI